MKKLLYLILIIFLFSCEEESEVKVDPVFCWKCKITTIYNATGYIPVTKIDSVTKCGWTEKEIAYYISIKSEVTKIATTGSNYTIVITPKYDCKKYGK